MRFWAKLPISRLYNSATIINAKKNLKEKGVHTYKEKIFGKPISV